MGCSLVNQDRRTKSSVLLRNHYFKTQLVYTPGNVDKFLIGLASQPQQKVDNYFSEDVKYIENIYIFKIQ